MSDGELRDTFAAAALTGLLVHANSGDDEETMDTPSDIAHTAYELADAMLRERLRKNASAYTAGVSSANETKSHDASVVVRLPPPNGGHGWNAAIRAVREALADAGVDWDTT